MNFAAFCGRHRRLAALCGLSLLLHLLALALFEPRIASPPPLDGRSGLRVRLAAAASSAPDLAPESMPEPAPQSEQASQRAFQRAPVQTPEPASAPVQPAPPAAGGPAAGAEPVQVPSRYRVAVPPSVTLSYDVITAAGTQGEARLAWETDGVQYRLALDGVAGNVESEGGTDDAGLAPARASYRQGSGRATIAFDRERQAIVLESLGRSVPDLPGSQDGATVLMQLAGIALADPDQMQEAVEIYVGRAGGAAVERYQLLGREQLATPAGMLDTLRLVRAAPAGALRLELWLAPGEGWLPVQLRTTAPDGSVRTQVVKAIQRAPAL
ncbi:DUF3108 domain-containing protein [Massilia sp. H6]|uniref:DUF3108 domain-containing protein n=1 Tax=Massilia sp. H6 TaxID=2970464 RepID=UPI002167BEF7|nr:DUF3108 domain-containing protein [Massilia sp. H6]UVW27308.1 DUF3108 domain-containing protein [Massilia sp. H6]